MQRAIIRYYRYNRPPAVYKEGFVQDDGRCLRTLTIIPPGIAARLAASWVADGLLPSGATIHSIKKHHFYSEYFTILELLDVNDKTLGYYSDIATPLEVNKDGEYELHDLMLDLWVFPDGSIRELDWDQFLVAERRRLIPGHLAAIARRTLRRLVQEVQSGRFPQEYIK